VNERDDIGRELHETRAEPTPEFAHELDERVAGWLRERPRRRLPSLRIAIPAIAGAAAAAVVVALAVSGGDGTDLDVSVHADVVAVEAIGKDRESEAAPEAAEGGFAAPRATLVDEGEPVVLRYFFTGATEGTVDFAGREASIKLPAGAGRLEISTDGVSAGTHQLLITVRSMPPYRQRIEIAG